MYGRLPANVNQEFYCTALLRYALLIDVLRLVNNPWQDYGLIGGPT